MDADAETAKFKFMLFVVVVFLASTFFAYMELKYSTAGKTAEGTVENVSERRTRRGGSVRVVHYRYRDAEGNLRNGSDDVRRDWSIPPGGKVSVEYLADTSRLAGRRNVVALVIFFGSLLALVAGGFLFWRHVREATGPARKPYKVPQRY